MLSLQRRRLVVHACYLYAMFFGWPWLDTVIAQTTLLRKCKRSSPAVPVTTSTAAYSWSLLARWHKQVNSKYHKHSLSRRCR